MKKWWSFFGVRHIQVVLLAIQLLFDGIIVQTILSLVRKHKINLNPAGGLTYVLRSFTPDQVAQMTILATSSIIVGYVLMIFFVTAVNNKYLMLISAFAEVACLCFLYFFTVTFGFKGFVTTTTLIMLFQSVHWPVAVNVLAKWLPPSEYSRGAAVLYGFVMLGKSIPTYFIANKNMGIPWQMACAFLCCNFAWLAVYLLVGAQDPQTSYLVRKAEWEMLSETIGPRKPIKLKIEIPWRGILTMAPLYGLIFTDIAQNLFIAANLSLILSSSNMNQVDQVAALFPIFVFAVAWIADALISHEYLTVNQARKTLNTICLWGASFFVAFMCYYEFHPQNKLIHNLLARYMAGLRQLSYVATMWDLAPNYASVIYCLASLPSWILITATSPFNLAQESGENVSLFHFAGLCLFLFNYPFLFCGTIHTRKFDLYGATDWRQESVLSYP